jgi:hypothetical protein
MVLDTLMGFLAEKWLGVILLLIIAVIVYKLVQKITRVLVKVVSFSIVLIVVYFLMSNLGLL